MMVQGVGPIGCILAKLELHKETYNPQLIALLANPNAGHGGDEFVFVGVNV